MPKTAGLLLLLLVLGGVASAEEPANEEASAPSWTAELLEHSLADVSEGYGSATMALQFGALLSRAQGDERWDAFRTIFFPRILAKQHEDGAFACVCLHECVGVTCDSEPPGGLGAMPGYMEGQKVYVTAIHCLILLLDRAPSMCAPPVPDAKGPVTPR